MKPLLAVETKRLAAEAAVMLVENGMTIGLGSGTTAKIFVDLLGERLASGCLKNVVGVPTSKATAQQAAALHIPLGELANYCRLDLAVDGADEVDPNLNLLKGWGGAMVREKLVELYAERFVIMVDETKLVKRLGTRGPLPIEVIPFGWQAQADWLADKLNCSVVLRRTESRPYLTDNQNYILSCHFADGITDPYQIQEQLFDRPGIVGHGLFLDMASEVLVSTPEGVNRLTR